VFDDVPAALTDSVARELYGLEANEVMEVQPAQDAALLPAAAIA
jgi:phosphonate transport system ATP-binding protein